MILSRYAFLEKETPFNRGKRVDDFQWLDTRRHSPNWKTVPPEPVELLTDDVKK